MDSIIESLKRQIWEKGTVDSNYQKDHVRKDACGAWMVYEDFGNRNSTFGWEIDHIYPESKLRMKKVPQDLIDSKENLRPLNWANNDSKTDDYPVYRSSVTSTGDHNVASSKDMEVNKEVQSKIESLFKDYGI